MSFRFNFGDCGEDEEIDDTESKIESVIPFKEHELDEVILQKSKDIISRNRGNVSQEYYGVKIIRIQNSVDLPKEFQNIKQDVIERKYEGGFRVWECVEDLVCHLDFLSKRKCLENKRILEIGCGNGIPGIYSLRFGNISHLDLQDYNSQVIETSTIPNVLINVNESVAKEKCNFFSGEWSDFVEVLRRRKTKKYDYIIGSEILYNPDNYGSLCNLFEEFLGNNNNSEVIIATKKTYFGLRGSSFVFENYLKKRKSKLCLKVEKEIIDDVSTIRQILVLKWNNDNNMII